VELRSTVCNAPGGVAKWLANGFMELHTMRLGVDGGVIFKEQSGPRTFLEGGDGERSHLAEGSTYDLRVQVECC